MSAVSDLLTTKMIALKREENRIADQLSGAKKRTREAAKAVEEAENPVIRDRIGYDYAVELNNLYKGRELYIKIVEKQWCGSTVQIGLSAWRKIINRVEGLLSEG